MKTFKNWKTQEVEEVFGLTEVENHPLLEKWLNAQCEISDLERKYLETLQVLLKKSVHFWNEMELKMKFLGPLLALVNYDTGKYQAFMERNLVVEKGEDTAVGTVDFLIAKGRQIPRSPFFSVHEYKPDPNSSKDPLGQLLIALVAIHQSNQKNKHDFPLYGAYVVGRLFYFVVFDGEKYAKSEPYVASQDAIFDIFCILKEVKVYIEAIIAAEK